MGNGSSINLRVNILQGMCLQSVKWGKKKKGWGQHAFQRNIRQIMKLLSTIYMIWTMCTEMLSAVFIVILRKRQRKKQKEYIKWLKEQMTEAIQHTNTRKALATRTPPVDAAFTVTAEALHPHFNWYEERLNKYPTFFYLIIRRARHFGYARTHAFSSGRAGLQGGGVRKGKAGWWFINTDWTILEHPGNHFSRRPFNPPRLHLTETRYCQ